LLIIANLIFALLPGFARAGVVQTVEGTSFTGVVRIEDGNLAISSSSAASTAPIHIAADNILDAAFVDRLGAIALQHGVMLVDGGVIAGDIDTANQNSLRLDVGDREVDIPMASIARIVFHPVKPATWARIPAGHSGAILDNGDFSEGDFQAISGSKLKISSLLFGVTEFDTDTKVQAVVLRDIQPASANWILRLRNGSVVLADKIQLKTSAVSVMDSTGHKSQINVGQIAQISAGPQQMDYLSDHKPDSVDSLDENPWAADMVMTNGVAMRLRGVSITRGISQTSGTALTFSLPEPRRALIARAGIPLDLPPYAKVQFVVVADGREAYRSPFVTSVDDAVFVNVPLAGVKQITLKVESNLRGDLGAIGLWGDVAFVKPLEQPATKPAE
jgi:hypothetical protein